MLTRLPSYYILMRPTQVVDQDPVFVLLLFLFAVSGSAASTQLLHIVPKQSAGEPLEHPWTSCGGARLREGLRVARGDGGEACRTLWSSAAGFTAARRLRKGAKVHQ